jgi:hypothetical protein
MTSQKHERAVWMFGVAFCALFVVAILAARLVVWGHA